MTTHMKMAIAVGVAAMLGAAQEAGAQSWEEGAWAAQAPMSAARPEAASVTVGDKMFVFGSRNHNNGGGTCATANNRTAEVYDLRTGAWAPLPPMLRDRGEAAAAEVDGVIYLIGGNNCFGNCWMTDVDAYDITTRIWTSVTSLPLEQRGWLSAVSTGGKVYVSGGANSHVHPSNFAYFHVYDPATNTWQRLPDMPRARSQHGSVAIDNKIFLFGGWNGSVVSEVDVFDIDTNQWSTVSTLPTPRHQVAVTMAGDRVYVIGGSTAQAEIVATVEEYDPAFNRWRTVTPLPHALQVAVAGSFGRTVYVAGGDMPVGGGAVCAQSTLFAGIPLYCRADMDFNGIGDIFDFLTFQNLFVAGCP